MKAVLGMPVNFRARLLVVVELVALGASLTLAVFLIWNPEAPLEPYLTATGLVFVATELFRRSEGKVFLFEGVERTPVERVKHHEVLRKRFKEEIYRCHTKNLRKDVVIRHVNRLDSYPDITDKPGISPWFKAGLLDTYHSGVKVGLGWHGLIETEAGFRFPNYKKSEVGDVTVMLIGEIPYDFIESVNIDGDEYYHFPHIFCHFANHGEPYQRMYFAEEVDMGNGRSYWKEIVSRENVTQNN